MLRVAATMVLTLLAASCLGFPEAEPPAGQTPDTTSVGNLLLEVEALQLFRQLNLTPEQLGQLRTLAKETMQAAAPRPVEAKVSDKLRKTLAELRDALLADKDNEKIDELSDRLVELREAEKATLGDDYEMTEAAREQAPKFLRALAPGQVAAFMGALAGEVPDPVQTLAEALEKARGLKDEDWQAFREGLSEEIGRLVAGLDADKAGECGEKVVQLLIVARSLSDDDFKKRKPDLEKKARAIVGDVGPVEVLRNEVEFRLAELLSNPRLEAALAARLLVARSK